MFEWRSKQVGVYGSLHLLCFKCNSFILNFSTGTATYFSIIEDLLFMVNNLMDKQGRFFNFFMYPCYTNKLKCMQIKSN